MAGPFERVESLRPGRSVFDLSYDVKTTGDMGLLYPIMCDEMVPGDRFDIATELVIRMMPLVAPVLHRINAYVHYFFVPYRILWDEWEAFITGGADGANASVLPRWEAVAGDVVAGKLWDYLGFPPGVVPTGAFPLDFVRRAYNRIYNEYYRDQTLVAEVSESNVNILRRAWRKDYFTSALLTQQRGIAPALPISGITNAVFSGPVTGTISWPAQGAGSVANMVYRDTTQTMDDAGGTRATLQKGIPSIPAANLANNAVDFSDAATFDVNDLRLAFQAQKWLERNNRAGVRYKEFLHAHFGVSPRDDRLQRPEFIGGIKSPIIVSEVLQTSETETTPQGTLAGHGISANARYIGKVTVQEYGLVMGILSIMPEPVYQQGINRQFLRRTKYDFYFPEFAHLGEQAIEMAEIYVRGTANENTAIFGYQGRFDEMRYKPSYVTGKMRDTFDYWHLSRQFGSVPGLNQSFIECNPDKRIFAAPAEDGFVIQVGNHIRAIRPLPIQSEPGFIDH